jgi:hypothetical protein
MPKVAAPAVIHLNFLFYHINMLKMSIYHQPRKLRIKVDCNIW